MNIAPPSTPPKVVTGWQLVALVAVVVGGVVAAGLLLSEPHRAEILGNVGRAVAPYAGTVLAAVAALVAALAARAAKHETSRQTPLIEATARQTNSVLTSKDAELAALREQLAAERRAHDAENRQASS